MKKCPIDWSEKSEKWTHELRDKLKKNVTKITIRNENNEKGIFWIDYEQFISYFSQVSICYTHLSFFEKYLTGFFYNQENTFKYYILKVESDTCFYFKLFNLVEHNEEISIDYGLCLANLKDDNFVKQISYREKVNKKKCLRMYKELIIGTYILAPFSAHIICAEGFTIPYM